jgi:hypothetical protein
MKLVSIIALVALLTGCTALPGSVKFSGGYQIQAISSEEK